MKAFTKDLEFPEKSCKIHDHEFKDWLGATLMAVQQNKKSRSRRDMRRSHDALTFPTLSINATTGEAHRRHHLTPDGYTHAGRKVIDTGTVYEEQE